MDKQVKALSLVKCRIKVIFMMKLFSFKNDLSFRAQMTPTGIKIMNSDRSKCFPSLNSTEKKKPCSSPKCSQSVFPQVTAINSFFYISFWNLFLLCSGSSGVGTVMYPDSRFRTEGRISLAGLVNPPRGLSALKRGVGPKARLPPQGSAFTVCVGGTDPDSLGSSDGAFQPQSSHGGIHP